MCAQSLAKELHKLLRNVSSFSDNQATIENYDEITEFDVIIIPNSGLYKKGKFSFTVRVGENYPDAAPSVNCNTTIYHPNIDTSGDVCLNLLSDDWESNFSLEDVVQGLLFLLYNPNLDDPLNEYFEEMTDHEEFESNVVISLQGGNVEGLMYERNQVEDSENESVVDRGSFESMKPVGVDINEDGALDSEEDSCTTESDGRQHGKTVVEIEEAIASLQSVNINDDLLSNSESQT